MTFDSSLESLDIAFIVDHVSNPCTHRLERVPIHLRARTHSCELGAIPTEIEGNFSNDGVVCDSKKFKSLKLWQVGRYC